MHNTNISTKTKNNVEKLSLMLSSGERKILNFILKAKDFDELCQMANMPKESVVRALQFLSNKGIINLTLIRKEQVVAGKRGIVYLREELPERRLMDMLSESGGELDFKNVKLNKQELTAALGTLKKKQIIALINGKIKLIGDATKKLDEEYFLEELPINVKKLNEKQKIILNELSKRLITEIERQAIYKWKITNIGEELIKSVRGKPGQNLIEQLTPEILSSNSWRGQKFRHYDIQANVPPILGGKPHYYIEFIRNVENTLQKNGFMKMASPMIVNEFWNFDALFQPQFHVAREWTDTYSINTKSSLQIPSDVIKRVKKIHEQKWHYKWQEGKARRAILRPQGTVVSALTLANLKQNIHQWKEILNKNEKESVVFAKYYALARCFRPDIVDATHLSEFNQLEGIIIGSNLNFKHLLGFLRKLAMIITGKSKNDIKFSPDYYPFTEPSVELDVKYGKWLEIGGAGIFRKEVIKSLLGEAYNDNITVLAWGLGIDRLAMIKYKLDDIRKLFTDELNFLRNVKL